MNLQKCEAALAKMASFLAQNHRMIDVCMVDFVTQNIFEKVLSCQMQQDLLQLSDQELVNLPQKLVNGKLSSTKIDSELDSFILEMSQLTLEGQNVVDHVPDKCDSILAHFDRFMSQKKMHEVLKMSDAVSDICSAQNVANLVDVGSGKAYLSQVLAATRKDLNILAIDSKSVNLQGAQKRSQNLEKQWEALIRRAICRASGEAPPRRGKHWKSKNVNEENERTSKLTLDNLCYDTLFVDTHTDLKSLFTKHFSGIEIESTFGLIGLHTCGNLAANSLQIFLANPSMKFCFNVGCCYHLIDEEFYQNPYNVTDMAQLNPCFPMSKLLKQKRFCLGKNARMVAAQPMDRLINNQELPNISLLWRAILQHILLIHNPNLGFNDQQVGRIAAKCDNFISYVEKSFDKLGIELKMSHQELQSIHDTMSVKYTKKLNSFYLLRSLFAPIIEGLILLDRLTFLHEQTFVQKASIVRLFDPVISPRCYALIANKS